MSFTIEDRPMNCCGMVMASGFSDSVVINPPKESFYGKRYTRDCTKEDVQGYFELLDQHQEGNVRNVSLITLSSDQRMQKELAEENGYVVIQEFYNPNSDNQVYIMTKTNYANKAEYEEARRDFEDSDY